MTHAPPRRSRIEIPLPSKPRDYRPGDGPPLAPVRLTLDHDTDAFIVEKRVLPGKPINGELKLELYYIVGWPDLPNARVSILATEILEYVSPRTLENWEYEQSLERDKEEEERLAAEKRKEEKRAKARAASISATGTSTPATPGQKRRGRPSKAEMLARQLAQQASFGKEDLANVPLPPTKPNGPSLSTPKKKLAQVSTDQEDLEDTDMNEAILKQLQGGSERDSGSPSAEDSGEPDMLDNDDGFSLEAFLPGPSSRGYAEFLVLNPSFLDPSESSRSISPSPLRHHSGRVSLRQKPQLTTPVPVPTYPKPAHKMMPSVPAGRTITPVPVPSYPNPKPKAPKPKHVPTVTPVPMPCYPIPKPKKPHEVTYTPVPPPVLPKAPETSTRPSAHNSSKTLTADVVRSGFTPAGRSRLEWNMTVSDKNEGELNDPPHTYSMTATPAAKANSSRKRKPAQPEGDQEWEVKRLEGDRVLETGGELVRFFKVRWAGNWPADQNPTWEPEENISQVLVRKYLKDKSMKTAQNEESSPGSTNKLKSAPAPTFKRKYSSVAEAFEGDANDEMLGTSSGFLADLQAREEDEYDGGGDYDYAGEELFQVTEQPKITRPMQKLRADAALLQELTDSFLLD